MKKRGLKIFVLLLILFNLIGCTTLRKSYILTSTPLNNTETDYKNYIWIRGYYQSPFEENSPLSLLGISSEGKYGKRELDILSDKVKIIYEEKVYFLDYDKSKKLERIEIYMNENDLVISKDFVLYLGKVRVDNKIIIDVPPLLIKRILEVEPNNPTFDVINLEYDNDIVYRGDIDGYKGN